MNSYRKANNSKTARSTVSLPLASAKFESKLSKTANLTRTPTASQQRVTTQKGKSAKSAQWSVPKSASSFHTKGVLSRRVQNEEFAYDLSRDELMFSRKFPGPMKTLSNEEKNLQQNGTRVVYLHTRYEHAPEQKYNFPEATSWRIGWFHRQLQQN